MRLSVFFMVVSTAIAWSATTYSQSTRLSVNLKDATVKDVIKAIEEQSEFLFLYQEGQVDLNRRVSIRAEGKQLQEILDEVFKGTDNIYIVSDRQVVIGKAPRKTLEAQLAALQKDMKVNFFQQQQKEITGKVTDASGDPLPGATVMVKGTTIGTVTDVDGNFTLRIPANAQTLQVSFVGMKTVELPIGNQTNFNVVLEEEAIGLQEVVAVGYGTMKKANLTGSVASVTSKDLEKRAVTQSSLLLQGKMSGISVRQPSGNPAENNASLLIRGQNTFSGAGNNPLVLVDGIESSIDAVNPGDIESVSILKDAASAAIYGSKAANGVILVQTKKGVTGKPVISYNAYLGKGSPTMLPEMVNSWEYAIAVNEASVNSGGSPLYTEDQIQKFKSGTDPINYPNFDHMNYVFGSGSGMETKHDLSVRGGTQGTQYLVSAGYFNHQGLIKKNSENQYNLRLNLDTKLRDNLTFSARLSGLATNNKMPMGAEGDLGFIVRGAMRNSNAILGVHPDGYYGRNETLHPEADLESDSFIKNNGFSIYSNAEMGWNISKDIKLTGQLGYTYGNSENIQFRAKYNVTPDYMVTPNYLRNTWSKNDALTMQAFAEYTKRINNHDFHLLGGVSGQTYYYKNIMAYRDQFPNNELHQINAGATANGQEGGGASRSRLASYFGRLNYGFMDKYLVEVNFRYDGSSRFPAKSRWGLFPSFSAAWRISEEPFFKQFIPWMNNFKIRASWGELGNQSIGDYPYQDVIYLGQNYPFGNTYAAGAAVTVLANKGITWETTRITDIGLDMSFINNKLSFTADYFIKNTKDILYDVSVSKILGASPSSSNAGTVQNKGWDFDIAYNNTIGDFNYGVSAIFTIVHNKVTKLANIEQDINRGLFIGYPIGSAYGYTSSGLFASDEEVQSAPTQPFPFLASAGGIKFLDISGPEGVPDGIVDSSYDRTIIGQPFPITTYGFTFTGGYKNLDFHFLLQGEGGRKDMVNIDHFFPLDNNGNIQREAFDKRWTQANPDPKAKYPKLIIMSTDFYRENKVDYWFRDATFLRLKNAQIGYSLPKEIVNKISLNRLRIYITGENLFTLTNYYKNWDPEMSTGGARRFYPLTKLYTVGVNIDF